MHPTSRVGPLALALASAAPMFVLYPAIRPFSDEVTLSGAAAFASTAWLLAHGLAMAAFILTAFGMTALRAATGPRAAGTAEWAFVLGWIGIGLVLPFYGLETFGLAAIGAESIQRQDASLLAIAAAARGGPGLLVFLVGLVVLAVAAILAAVATWRAGLQPRWAAAPLAIGLVLFIPQFFWSQPLRVAHGLLVGGGCLSLALALWRHRPVERGR